jgi:hypothetical protein
MHVRAISIGEALSHAQAVMKANRKMSWEMVNEANQPKILWARIAQVHEDTEVAQVAVKFDTEQVGPHPPLASTTLITCPVLLLSSKSRFGRSRTDVMIGLDDNQRGQGHEIIKETKSSRELCL